MWGSSYTYLVQLAPIKGPIPRTVATNCKWVTCAMAQVTHLQFFATVCWHWPFYRGQLDIQVGVEHLSAGDSFVSCMQACMEWVPPEGAHAIEFFIEPFRETRAHYRSQGLNFGPRPVIQDSF